MRFQIECNRLLNSQTCLTCHKQFDLQEARLIICDDEGQCCGDVCPECIAKGAKWIDSRLPKFNQKLSA
ncbi:hypothetical protein VB711_14735 [Cronbergia sp. UHCC 0137]|uniref:hypothetical protein n=1 Tax=Cronbergia sp. UHCC 0137 TaxID=3110239 RepID=UPI002B21910C|nr:hypothetical protein [Cronbergia sp. UHCC 0137]MEA5619083.1 hypothetical protein [Cronbergia sp. UHCC 0137]